MQPKHHLTCPDTPQAGSALLETPSSSPKQDRRTEKHLPGGLITRSEVAFYLQLSVRDSGAANTPPGTASSTLWHSSIPTHAITGPRAAQGTPLSPNKPRGSSLRLK